VVAPHHLGPVAVGYLCFDVLAVKPLVTLDVKPVSAKWQRGVDV
jgi:hypothetical protein